MKSLLFMATLVVFGCGRSPEPHSWQGVLEHEERHLAFELSGRIAGVEVARGDEVSTGQKLAVLDPGLEAPLLAAKEAELRAVEAELKLLEAGPRKEDVRATAAQLAAARRVESLANKEHVRYAQLAAKGASPEVAADRARLELTRARGERQVLEQRLQALRHGARPQEIAALEAKRDALKASVAAYRERLARMSLYSALDGEVLDVHLDPGEIAAAGAPVITVGEVQPPYADVFVPQGDLDGLAVGTAVTLRVDEHDGTFTGKVEDVGRRTEYTPRYIFSEEERAGLVVRVRIRVDDPEEKLHAGVPVFVERAP